MLSTGNPQPLQLLATFPGSAALEAKIQRDLKAHRITGKWFEPHEEVFAYMRALAIPEHERDANGTTYAILRRPSEDAPTLACPFCGRCHTHGMGDGHRVAHCANPERPKIALPAGLEIRAADGYIVRTGLRIGAA
jgi:hypothetical protein